MRGQGPPGAGGPGRQMTRFLGYIAMSLDARIADRMGGVDWLAPFNDPSCDFGYADFYAGVDLVVMGRRSYDFALGQPEWPYAGKRCIVVTRRHLDGLPMGVETRPPDFHRLRAELMGSDAGAVWIMGGGITQRAALEAEMFDELRLFVMPVILGGGAMVFADGRQLDAELAATRTWPRGVVELSYRFRPPGSARITRTPRTAMGRST